MERPVLSEDTIERNIRGIERTLRKLLVAPPGAADVAQPLVLNNLDWFGSMNLLTFLRDVGEWASTVSAVSDLWMCLGCYFSILCRPSARSR